MPHPINPAQPNFAVIDGSAGYRAVLSAFLLAHWPDASIEEVDPFAETLRGMGLAFGSDSDVILLGGIGTYAEASASLQRLRARENCPPVVVMVARELEPQVATLLEAGAASILFKDAFSKRALVATLTRLLETPSAQTKTALSAPYPDTQTFGQFSFITNSQSLTVRIEHFRFVATLASSEMAQVFHAEGIDDRRHAVIKIPLNAPLHALEVRSFCERFRLISRLNGRGVVRYLDAGVADSWPYVVLEHLPGGDLRRRMAAGVTPGEALQLLAKLSRALATFHSGSFAHMDLKPENIFFRDDELVLIDFNISTPFGKRARNRITGDVLGSPFYMSPEQGRGQAVDAQSDLYSAGVVLYEMLTGSQPYTGESATQVIYKHIHEEVPLLPKRIRVYQPLIDALMAKNRSERVATAADLGNMLLPYLRDGDAAGTDTDSSL